MQFVRLIGSRTNAMLPIMNSNHWNFFMSLTQTACSPFTHLVLCHGSHNKRADHSRQGAHTVGNSHQDAGITRSDVKVVHVETCRDRRERASGQSVNHTPPLSSAWLGTLTRYCKSAEAHRQHQERDGHTFTVGVAHHQQQGGLHAKTCGDQRSEVKQMST